LVKGRVDKTGNRYFVDSEYRKAIKNAGFDYRFQLLNYPVFRRNGIINAGNHFGIKRIKI